MKEIWKDIPNYKGLYKISNFGNIKSFYSNKILKPSYDRFGYARFSATKNKKQKTLRIHRLVAEIFIPNINNLPQINHKDGNKKNNSTNNLEWVTDSQNKLHAYASGLMRGKNRTRQNLPRYK